MTTAATTDFVAAVRQSLAFARAYTGMLLADIPDEDMASQPGGVTNHPAWTIAHLCVAGDGLLDLLGQDPIAPAGWSERFTIGTSPTQVRDDYPSKDELVQTFDRQLEAIGAAVGELPPERLAAPNPSEALRDIAPTVRDAIQFMGVSHVAMHLGQIAAWRTSNDLPRAFG
jgi:hypothetical protein